MLNKVSLGALIVSIFLFCFTLIILDIETDKFKSESKLIKLKVIQKPIKSSSLPSSADDDPHFVTGSFNYYAANREPTSSEPLLNVGYFDPIQILFWKTMPTGDLWLLQNAVYNDDGSYTLTWGQVSFVNKLKQ